MTTHDGPVFEITPSVLLKAYSCGIFPMAQSADTDQLYWIEPEWRGVLPLNAIHIPKRLARTIRQQPYEIRINTAFDAVIDGCAADGSGRESTWINDQIRSLYGTLFRAGHCHTVEAWHEGRLVGGLYGVALGGAFFGESMFSTMRDASKITLMYLCARLIYGGYILLDTQFVTEHLQQFGTIELEKRDFQSILDRALGIGAEFTRLPEDAPPTIILDIIKTARTPG